MILRSIAPFAMLVALLSPQTAAAQNDPEAIYRASLSLDFNRYGIANFCAAVSSPLTELHPKHPAVRYQWQTMLFRWAGVVPTDDDGSVNRKVEQFLNAHRDQILCSQPDFSPNNGNIYKLAVARQSDRFIDYTTSHVHVDLNQIDAVDGMTVLDFISDRRANYGEKSTMARTLGRYYDRFRAAGARHASEIR